MEKIWKTEWKISANDTIQYLGCLCKEERIHFLVSSVGGTDCTTARVSLHIMKNFLTIKRAAQV